MSFLGLIYENPNNPQYFLLQYVNNELSMIRHKNHLYESYDAGVFLENLISIFY